MSVEKCKTTALKYAAMYVKTEGQIREYLKRKEFDHDEIDAAIEFVKEFDYIDDVKYCQNYYKAACAKGRGRRRVEQELQNKKISINVIRTALDEFLSEENPEYDEIIEEIGTEEDRATAVSMKMLKNHIGEGKKPDKNFFAKVGRRLVTLGYGRNVIYPVIKKLIEEGGLSDGSEE